MTGFAQMLMNDNSQLTSYQRLLADDGPEPAFRLLIAHAQSGKTVTYKEMAEHIGKELKLDKTNDWHHMGLVVGSLMYNVQRICGMKIPPINILMIRSDTKLPGFGADPFVDNYIGAQIDASALTDLDRAMLMQTLIEDVFTYEKWEAVYRRVFGKKLAAQSLPKVSKKKPSKSQGGGKAGGESAAHKALKRLVFENPYDVVGEGEHVHAAYPEVAFRSADRVDVLINCKESIYVVEVKPQGSDHDELQRGVYQCVKYKALAEAEERVNIEAIYDVAMTDYRNSLKKKDPLPKPKKGNPRPVYAVLVHAVPRGMTADLKMAAETLEIDHLYWRQP